MNKSSIGRTPNAKAESLCRVMFIWFAKRLWDDLIESEMTKVSSLLGGPRRPSCGSHAIVHVSANAGFQSAFRYRVTIYQNLALIEAVPINIVPTSIMQVVTVTDRYTVATFLKCFYAICKFHYCSTLASILMAGIACGMLNTSVGDMVDVVCTH